MNLNDLLSQHLPDELLAQMAGKVGVQDPNVGVAASKSIINTLMQGLMNNSSNESGAEGLLGAIDRDHNGSILDDVMGFLGNSGQSGSDQMTNSAGILGHILGFKQQNVTNGVSKVFGMDTSTVISLMSMLAPVVMGLIGKARANNQVDQTNIQQVLETTVHQQTDQNSGLGIFGKLLDTDGDGNISDDLLQMGMKFLLKR
ncbi:MAG: DUF937 domain-containing protein [Saprospiraceae bacterium]|nr:DUF937 domain-containing protein [Candidatus Vicinibacter affinis]MBK6573038.1 DUF937 domain-containing protein [Candidatus Vicinibacter affinis]MBK8402596.1 DUF937 domain-containing protein [Candidatus Vicinibacter affinis]MBK8640873.1 DUF937 domain-containing protein [Candidatus Vicinibacter affinis]HQX42930.1 DUF937 domain-containing protein [Saprospiraceae bacterium]